MTTTLDAGERLLAGEQAATLAVASTLQLQLEERYRSGTILRDAHPKHHGLADAVFTVAAQAPELRRGLFAELGQSYEACVRFSNSHPLVGHDLGKDVRGFALKVFAAPGENLLDSSSGEHDFILTTGPAFFARDIVDFVDFPEASESALWSARFFLWPPLRWRGALALLRARKLPPDPFQLTYFSQSAYRLGPHYVKYVVRSELPVPGPRRWYLRAGVRQLLSAVLRFAPSRVRHRIPGYNALSEAMDDILSRGEVVLGLYVQRWQERAAPARSLDDAVENTSTPWRDAEVKEEKVATIVLPRQRDATSSAKRQQAERMSFNPWRTSAEHRPLGSINRGRLQVYLAIARLRRST